MQYEWYSPLSPEECARRIKARLSNGSSFWHSDHPFWGHVWERGFSVRLAQGWRNPMAPFFKAHLEPGGSGTVVRSECRILKAAKIGATIWALLWILLPCTLTVSVDVVWITFLLALGDSLRALDEETYRTLLTLPIAMWWMPVMGVVFALGRLYADGGSESSTGVISTLISGRSRRGMWGKTALPKASVSRVTSVS